MIFTSAKYVNILVSYLYYPLVQKDLKDPQDL